MADQARQTGRQELPDVDPQVPLYPLKFRPRFVSRMWGGRRLQFALHKPLPPGEQVGESWELYDFPPGVIERSQDWTSAQVANGGLAGHTLHELVLAMPHRLLGNVQPVPTRAGPQFPLLVKFLDAQQDLSVQVHPDEAYAAAHPEAVIKNEAWYVMAAEPGARLLKGLKPGTTRQQFEAALADGSVERLIHSVPARVGDVHYLPSGTVHALGAGMLVAEVQTPSDTTFRVYDFKRIDPATGRERELHVQQALEVIDFGAGGSDEHRPITSDGASRRGERRSDEGAGVPGREGGIVAVAPQFTLAKWSSHEAMRSPLAAGAPSALIVIEGEGGIVGEGFSEVKFAKGDTLLIPADLVGSQLDPESECEWLEVTFPR